MVIIKVYYTNHKEDNYSMGTEIYNRTYISVEQIHDIWENHIENGIYHDYYVSLESVV